MTEPSSGVVSGNGLEGVNDGLIQSFRSPSFTGAQELFELEPSFFNGIEVGRVGRQIEQFGATGFDSLLDAANFVRRQVVHDHYVAGLEFGTQHLLHIGGKHLAVGGRFDGHDRLHTAQAHRSQRGQYFPVTLGRGFGDPLAFGRSAPQSCHLGRNPTFVQEDQLLRGDCAESFQECFAPLPIDFGVSLPGMERLFFNRNPILPNTTHSEGTLTRSCFS